MEDADWDDPAFQRFWKAAALVKRPTPGFKKFLMEPLKKAMEARDEAIQVSDAVLKKVRALEEKVRQAWKKWKGPSESDSEAMQKKLAYAIDTANARQEEAMALRYRVWTMRSRKGKRPKSPPSVETRLPKSEKMGATGTGEALPLHCFSVAVRPMGPERRKDEKGRKEEKEQESKRLPPGPPPRRCDMDVLIVDAEATPVFQALRDNSRQRGANVRYITDAQGTSSDRCTYNAVKTAARLATKGPVGWDSLLARKHFLTTKHEASDMVSGCLDWLKPAAASMRSRTSPNRHLDAWWNRAYASLEQRFHPHQTYFPLTQLE